MNGKFHNLQIDKSKSSPLKITLKLKGEGGGITMYWSSKTRRIYSILKHENFLEGYLKVDYGKSKDVFGKNSQFINDGTYKNKEDLISALSAFTEKSLVDYLTSEGSG